MKEVARTKDAGAAVNVGEGDNELKQAAKEVGAARDDAII